MVEKILAILKNNGIKLDGALSISADLDNPNPYSYALSDMNYTTFQKKAIGWYVPSQNCIYNLNLDELR